MTIRPPSPPVVGGHPHHHSGTRNKPIMRLVIHSAVIPCEPGRARQLGQWNRDGTTAGSWHYAIDPDEAIQCSYDSYVCWHAPPNAHSLGFEMCDTPGRRPDARRGSRLWWNLRKSWRWAGRNHRKTLHRTARLVAHAALAYDVPIRFLSPAELLAGRRGITTHANVSKAFRQSSHWDPGWWPRRRFMRLVRRHARELKGRKTR